MALRAWCSVLGLLLASVAGAGESAYVNLSGETMAQGRAIWLANCERCHGYGVAGAPIPMTPADWKPRLEQDQATLYRHAIEGFFGPRYTMMPPRGGNAQLSDAEVKAAVDYMTGLARHYINQQEQTK